MSQIVVQRVQRAPESYLPMGGVAPRDAKFPTTVASFYAATIRHHEHNPANSNITAFGQCVAAQLARLRHTARVYLEITIDFQGLLDREGWFHHMDVERIYKTRHVRHAVVQRFDQVLLELESMISEVSGVGQQV